MTESVVAYTQARDGVSAARELAARIKSELPGAPPDALVLFASPRYEQDALLEALVEQCRPKALVGSSSAGEFTARAHGQGLACALAIRSSEMRFAAGIGHGLKEDRAAAAREMVSTFDDT